MPLVTTANCGHEKAIRALIDGLRADLERLESMRRNENLTRSVIEEKFAYKLVRSLEAEASRIHANQDGEHIGYQLHEHPSTVPGMPFTSQCGYTAAVAAQHIVGAAFDLLVAPPTKANRRQQNSSTTSRSSACG